jgi:arabinofuranan 3-O-arabinosyltransferase
MDMRLDRKWATFEQSKASGLGTKLARPVELISFALLITNLVCLFVAYVQTTDGSTPDFVALWAAGRMALFGQAATAYDWSSLKALEESILDHPVNGYLGWPYPPTVFFIVVPLSLLPYADAFIVWVLGTFIVYLVAIRIIIGDRVGYFLAASFPAVLANFIIGQNGLLSAGLIGGALVLMERQPIMAGVLLGLLTYKPHLGVLFPIALFMSGRCRVLWSAGVVATLMAGASWATFGGETWGAFLFGIGHTVRIETFADWGKLQSTFGLIRALGGSDTLAWLIQAIVAIVVAAAIVVLWRSRATYEVKAAGLSTGVMLVTSHLLIYDLAILAVPLAFLFRLGRERGFLAYELAGMGLACLLVLMFSFVVVPVGFIAVLVVAALVFNRALSEHRAVAISQNCAVGCGISRLYG